MAVARSGRSSPPIALIIFIFLWVVSTGLAAFFYVQASKVEKEAAKDREELKQIATPAERRGTVPELLREAGNKHTAIAEAMDQINRLKTKMGASGQSTDEAIRTAEREADRAELKDTNLIGAIQAAYQASQTAKEQAKAAEAKLQTAQDAYDKAKKDFTQTRDAYAKTVEERKADIERLSAEAQKLNAERDTLAKKYEDEKTKLIKDFEDKIRELLVKTNEANDLANRQKSEVDRLKRIVATLKPGPQITSGIEPDGKVIRTASGSNEIWINLGRNQHVTPGLTFSVYDPKATISFNVDPKNPDAPIKGKKADIEVVEVGENESLARITRAEKNQTVMNQDILNNPVYNREKNRQYHFVIFGDFDLDNDGIATPAEKEKLVRLIQAWGGAIDDTLSTQSDFLVMGAQPGSANNKFGAQTAQSEDMAKQRAAEQKQYQDLVGQAKDFSVPVLNANRFLSMIGYYSTTVVR